MKTNEYKTMSDEDLAGRIGAGADMLVVCQRLFDEAKAEFLARDLTHVEGDESIVTVVDGELVIQSRARLELAA